MEGRSPWRHVLSPSGTRSLFRQMVCASAGGQQPGWGRFSAQNATRVEQLCTLALPPCFCGTGGQSAQAFWQRHAPRSSPLLWLQPSVPFWLIVPVLGRKEERESHMPGHARGSSTCQGKGAVEVRCRAGGLGSMQTEGRESEPSPQAVFEVLGCSKHLMWSAPLTLEPEPT